MKTSTFLLFTLGIISSLSCVFAQAECGPGTYSPRNGKEPCLPCPRGEYQGRDGKKRCKPCPLGTSTVTFWAMGRNRCESCPPGALRCNLCKEGYYNNTESVPSGVCMKCPSGTYGSGGIKECRTCGSGEISFGKGAKACQRCPPGTKLGNGDFCIRDSNSCSVSDRNPPLSCKACPPGTYSQDGFGPCSLCPVGRYSEKIATEIECTRCKFNAISPSGSRSEGACEPSLTNGDPSTLPAFTASPSPVFDSCPAGEELVRGRCTPCKAGYFKAFAGASACIACRRNTISSSSGSDRCTNCDLQGGYITWGEGASRCVYCPAEAAKFL